MFVTVDALLAPEGWFYLAVTRRNFDLTYLLEVASAQGFTWEVRSWAVIAIARLLSHVRL